MGKPLSMDLRSRALAAVDEGMSCRAAATRFGVAAATVIRWHDQRRSTGSCAAKPQRGDTRSRRIEAHRETVLALHEARRDITLDELRRELSQAGVTVAISTLHRFFARHGITRKKGSPELVEGTGHAVEQDRADVLSAREDWFDGQFDLDPARLVFIDETWTATNMTRSHGHCHRGERLRMGYPHGHRKTTTLVAGLRMTGMVAPMGLVRGLCPIGPRARSRTRRRGDHGQPVQPQACQRPRGHRSRGRPPHVPPALQSRLQPDREGVARLKAMLRRAGERTVSGLWSLIGRLVDLFQSQECANYFSSCGYDPD